MFGRREKIPVDVGEQGNKLVVFNERWHKMFPNLVDEAADPARRTPRCEALNQKQKQWLDRVEKEVDKRLTSLDKGRPIVREKVVKYSYKDRMLDEDGRPVIHDYYGFEMNDYHMGDTMINTEQDRYKGVNIHERERNMAGALAELYLSKGLHVLITSISLNDPDSVRMREGRDSTAGQFYEMDVCQDHLPTPVPNPFSNVTTTSIGA